MIRGRKWESAKWSKSPKAKVPLKELMVDCQYKCKNLSRPDTVWLKRPETHTSRHDRQRPKTIKEPLTKTVMCTMGTNLNINVKWTNIAWVNTNYDTHTHTHKPSKARTTNSSDDNQFVSERRKEAGRRQCNTSIFCLDNYHHHHHRHQHSDNTKQANSKNEIGLTSIWI